MSVSMMILSFAQEAAQAVAQAPPEAVQAAAAAVPAAAAPASAPVSAVSSNVIQMVLDAGPVVKGVMGALMLFSLVSWAIILSKAVQLSRAGRNSNFFLDSFWKSRSLANLYAEAADFGSSPIAQIFRVGYQELGRVHKARLDQRTAMENVQRALRRSSAAEGTRLFKYLPFLATCGNAAPFIGLFGTVWGIMDSFHEIGLAGSANLATVAPGISEALVATAMGLAAAIPAVIFFNYYNSWVREQEAEMANFTADFVNILERDLLKRSSTPAAHPQAKGQED
ncbi:MAG: protein TolQ [Candidatus Adiutrix sp.]|jgi:biopolymer transport protein TolQ|nr:protein TolQ [Candidatus Adiutrix sp.]